MCRPSLCLAKHSGYSAVNTCFGKIHFATDCFGHRSKCLSVLHDASHLSITLLFDFSPGMFQLVLLNVSNI